MINRGQTAASTIPLAIIISLFLFMSGTLVISFITPVIDSTRAELSCNATPGTGGAMLTCLFISGIIPYFIFLFVSTAAGYLIARLLIGEGLRRTQ